MSVEGKVCETKFKGKFSTNLKVHLKSKHPHQHEELLQKEKEIVKKKENVQPKSKRSFKGQKKLTEIFRKTEKYGKDHPRYKQITMKLAVFVASTSTPNSIVENTAFVSLLEELDSQYPVPSRCFRQTN